MGDRLGTPGAVGFFFFFFFCRDLHMQTDVIVNRAMPGTIFKGELRSKDKKIHIRRKLWAKTLTFLIIFPVKLILFAQS